MPKIDDCLNYINIIFLMSNLNNIGLENVIQAKFRIELKCYEMTFLTIQTVTHI